MNAERHDLLAKLRIERESDAPAAEPSPRFPRYALWIGGVLAGILLLIAGVFIGRAGSESTPPAASPADKPAAATANKGTSADATAAAPAPGPDYVLDASGYVVARRMATVSSKFTGKVTEILVEEGMAVEAGQVLARMEADNARTEFNLARSRVAAMQAAEREARARLQEAEVSLARTENLVSRNLVSLADLDTARAAVESLRASMDARAAERRVAEQQLELARQNLEDTEIRAPFAGVVTVKNAQPGEIVSPISAGGGHTRTGICTLVDMQSLEIEVDVNEAYIKRVFPGQRVHARLDAYPDWTIPAKVAAVVPTADRQKATIKVRIEFEELDPRILPEMGIKVSFLEKA